MIKQIEGSILDIADNYIVVEASKGIGLQVFIPDPAQYTVKDNIHLFTHLVLRENHIALYGFNSKEQESVFKTLLSIPKVGARTALGILSVFPLADLFHCIQEGAPETLTKAPGVGATTARKIHLHLSEKWKDNIPQTNSEPLTDCYSEANDLLQEMGLHAQESQTILRQIRQRGSTATTAEELVAEVLKNRK